MHINKKTLQIIFLEYNLSATIFVTTCNLWKEQELHSADENANIIIKPLTVMES